MRGDHTSHNTFTFTYMGSSPHARGPQLPVELTLVVYGIIPACAGTTWNGS